MKSVASEKKKKKKKKKKKMMMMMMMMKKESNMTWNVCTGACRRIMFLNHRESLKAYNQFVHRLKTKSSKA